MWHDDQRGDQRVVSGRAEASVAGAADDGPDAGAAGVDVDTGVVQCGVVTFGGVAVLARGAHDESFR